MQLLAVGFLLSKFMTGTGTETKAQRVERLKREKNPWEGDWVSNYNWVKHEPLFDRI